MKLIPVIATVAFFTSCSPTRFVDVPAPENAPYFNKKGQNEVAAYYSNSVTTPRAERKRNGFDLQGAYAFSNHFAATIDYSYRGENEQQIKNNFRAGNLDSAGIKYRRSSIATGLGYFLPINREKNTYLNIYAGISVGHTSIADNGRFYRYDTSYLYSANFKTNIRKIYIQPGFTFFAKYKISCAVATRFSFKWFSAIETNYDDNQMLEYGLSYLKDRMIVSFEPSYSAKIPVPDNDWITMKVVLTSAIPITEMDEFTSRFFCGSFGVSFDFSKLKKK